MLIKNPELPYAYLDICDESRTPLDQVPCVQSFVSRHRQQKFSCYGAVIEKLDNFRNKSYVIDSRIQHIPDE